MHTYDGTLRVMVSHPLPSLQVPSSVCYYYMSCVQTYQGVSKKYVSPLTLANCDVVLASYEVLCSELYHVTSIGFNKKLRHPKRFSSYPSPLTAVQWWRVSPMREGWAIKSSCLLLVILLLLLLLLLLLFRLS